jgi:hypothetical protein
MLALFTPGKAPSRSSSLLYRSRLRGVVARQAAIDLDDHGVFGRETHPDTRRSLRSVHEQPGGDQQRQRQGQLGDDEWVTRE